MQFHKRLIFGSLTMVLLAFLFIIGPATEMTGMSSQNSDQPLGTIYWSNPTSILRANVDGSNVTTLLSGLGDVFDLSIDIEGEKIYWVDAGEKKIQRANLDGSEVEDVVIGISAPYALALDMDRGKVYWTVSGVLVNRVIDSSLGKGFGKIQRANLDGTEIETLITGLDQPSAIALDSEAEKMYWTDSGSPGSLRRANLDGSEIEGVVRRIGNVYGTALDSENEKVYWATNFTRIERANLDGTDLESLIDEGQGSGVTAYLELDLTGDKLYYMHIAPDNNNDLTLAGISIRKANLNGSNREVLFSNPGQVSGMALGH